jgi:hypothetical protein
LASPYSNPVNCPVELVIDHPSAKQRERNRIQNLLVLAKLRQGAYWLPEKSCFGRRLKTRPGLVPGNPPLF